MTATPPDPVEIAKRTAEALEGFQTLATDLQGQIDSLTEAQEAVSPAAVYKRATQDADADSRVEKAVQTADRVLKQAEDLIERAEALKLSWIEAITKAATETARSERCHDQATELVAKASRLLEQAREDRTKTEALAATVAKALAEIQSADAQRAADHGALASLVRDQADISARLAVRRLA